MKLRHKKTYWFINEYGSPTEAESYGRETLYDKARKSFGNSFATKEEAERAAKKLVAWKRLKDKGFHISGWDNSIGDDYYKPSQIVIELNGNPDWDEYDNINDIKEELDLLFGGEE